MKKKMIEKIFAPRKCLALSLALLIACHAFFLQEAKAPEEHEEENAAVQAEEALGGKVLVKEGCFLLQTMAFSRCGHSVSRRIALPGELIGSGLKEMQDHYSLWQIDEMREDQVTMKREIALFCPMHKVLMADEAGQIVLAENRYGDGMAVIKGYERSVGQFALEDQDALLLGMGFDSGEDAEAWLLAH